MFDLFLNHSYENRLYKSSLHHLHPKAETKRLCASHVCSLDCNMQLHTAQSKHRLYILHTR
jgi:hypothetical protein